MVEAGKSTYQGKNESDLIEEKIDEVILRALGLDDVFDLDYGTYKTLLKERMMADRMGQKMDSSEVEAVTNEYKRVKTKTGRFRLNKKKVSASAFKTKKTGPTTAPIRTASRILPGSTFAPAQKLIAPEKETAIVQAPQQQTAIAKTKQAYTYNFSKIEGALDDINKSLKGSFSFEKEKEKKKKQDEGRKKKKERESNLEKTIGAIAKIGKKILQPLKGPLDYIINWITYTFLGKVVHNLLNWMSDPDNAKKMMSLGRFFKDWWPALVGAYLIFGNSLGRFVSRLIFTVGAFTTKMLVGAIPKLLRVVRTPLGAGALLFGAGAAIPMLMPETVDEQERKTSKAVKEQGQDKVRTELERKANKPNFFERLTGQDAEAKEQLYKMDTGQTKSYGFRKGGKVTTASGTDIKGAGVDTQLIAARPGEVVINKETVDALGANFFLSLNKKYGGSNANKPKLAKNVQSAAGGGLVLPAFANGGMIGERNEVPVGGTYMGRRGAQLQQMYNAVAGELSNIPTRIGGGNILKNLLTEVKKYNDYVYSQRTGGGMQMPSLGDGGNISKGLSTLTNQGLSFGSGLYNQVSGLANRGLSDLSKLKNVPVKTGAGFFDFMKNVSSTKTYKEGALRMEKVQDKIITIGDQFVKKLPDGPFREMMDKGILPIPSGNATMMRNLTFAKALLGPLGRPFKILSNKEVDEMRQKTIEKTMGKSGLIVDPKTGEVKMNWNQQDINKGAKGGGAYTDDLGARGAAFNSILGRFSGSTEGKGNVLYTDDRYNFNRTVGEYADLAKQGLLKGSMSDATYYGASMLGRFAQDIGWLNQRALGSRIEVGKVDRSKIDPKTGKMKSSQQIAAERDRAVKQKYGQSVTMYGANDPRRNQTGYTSRFARPAAGKTSAPTKKPQRAWYDPRGWIGKQGGGITESTGINMPGATADRQLIATQPGEYILPVDAVMKLGGVSALDRLVATLDSNSTPAKMGARKLKPIPGPPSVAGLSGMMTLPPITSGSSSGGGRSGRGERKQVPSFSATSPYTGERNNNADVYGIR